MSSGQDINSLCDSAKEFLNKIEASAGSSEAFDVRLIASLDLLERVRSYLGSSVSPNKDHKGDEGEEEEDEEGNQYPAFKPEINKEKFDQFGDLAISVYERISRNTSEIEQDPSAIDILLKQSAMQVIVSLLFFVSSNKQHSTAKRKIIETLARFSDSEELVDSIMDSRGFESENDQLIPVLMDALAEEPALIGTIVRLLHNIIEGPHSRVVAQNAAKVIPALVRIFAGSNNNNTGKGKDAAVAGCDTDVARIKYDALNVFIELACVMTKNELEETSSDENCAVVPILTRILKDEAMLASVMPSAPDNAPANLLTDAAAGIKTKAIMALAKCAKEVPRLITNDETISALIGTLSPQTKDLAAIEYTLGIFACLLFNLNQFEDEEEDEEEEEEEEDEEDEEMAEAEAAEAQAEGEAETKAKPSDANNDNEEDMSDKEAEDEEKGDGEEGNEDDEEEEEEKQIVRSDDQSRESRQLIIKHGGIERVAALLSEQRFLDDEIVASNALAVLSGLNSETDREVANVAVQLNIFDCLMSKVLPHWTNPERGDVFALAGSNESNVVGTALELISDLIIDKQDNIENLCSINGSIHLLVQLLKSDHIDTLKSVVTILATVASHSGIKLACIIGPFFDQASTALMLLLSSSDTSIQYRTCVVLFNLAFDHATALKLYDAGALVQLIQLLSKAEETDIQQFAALALWNIIYEVNIDPLRQQAAEEAEAAAAKTTDDTGAPDAKKLKASLLFREAYGFDAIMKVLAPVIPPAATTTEELAKQPANQEAYDEAPATADEIVERIERPVLEAITGLICEVTRFDEENRNFVASSPLASVLARLANTTNVNNLQIQFNSVLALVNMARTILFGEGITTETRKGFLKLRPLELIDQFVTNYDVDTTAINQDFKEWQEFVGLVTQKPLLTKSHPLIVPQLQRFGAWVISNKSFDETKRALMRNERVPEALTKFKDAAAAAAVGGDEKSDETLSQLLDIAIENLSPDKPLPPNDTQVPPQKRMRY